MTLTGDGEDPDANDTLQYAWTQTGGSTVTLSAPSAAETTFTAPTGLSEDAVLTFTVKVTDAGGLFGEDTATVTVVPPDAGALTVAASDVVCGCRGRDCRWHDERHGLRHGVCEPHLVH